jgi:uncharacterized membrane protein YkvA (DUF1232 family)
MRPRTEAFAQAFGQAHDRIRLTARESAVRRDFFAKVKRVMAVVPFVDEAVAAYFCTVDARTPRWVKLTLLGALAYFIAPADAVPDFVAALGYTDDAAVLLGAVRAVGSSITPEHRARAQAFLKGEPMPGKAAGDAPIP